MLRSVRKNTRLQSRVQQELMSSQESQFSDARSDQGDMDPEERERQARERVLLERRLDKQAYDQFLMDNGLDAHQYPMTRFAREHARHRVVSDAQSEEQAHDADPLATE